MHATSDAACKTYKHIARLPLVFAPNAAFRAKFIAVALAARDPYRSIAASACVATGFLVLARKTAKIAFAIANKH